MKCPFCRNQDDKVIDSRVVRDGDAIRRRRECTQCKKRYTTYEYIESVTHSVIKRDGRREDFDRNKLEKGIKLACTKRQISFDTVQVVVDNIIEKLNSMHQKEIHHKDIGELVMNELKIIDHVAYVRFASVYRKFEAKEDFVKEVLDIDQNEKTGK
ncbi:transcriptional regulator NrdR [candidate division KSB1 bacterium]